MRIKSELSVNKTLNYSSTYWELLTNIFNSENIIESKTTKKLFHPSQLRNNELFLLYDENKKDIFTHLRISNSKKFVVFELKPSVVIDHIKKEIKELLTRYKKIAKAFLNDFFLLSSDSNNNDFLVKFFTIFTSEPMTPRKKQDMIYCLDQIHLENEITKQEKNKKYTICQDDLERIKIALKNEIQNIYKAYLTIGPYQVANLCLINKNDLAISISGLCNNVDDCLKIANDRACRANYYINQLTKLFEFIDLDKLFDFEGFFSSMSRHLAENPNKNSVSRNIFTKFDFSDDERANSSTNQKLISVSKTIFNFYGIYLSYCKTLSLGEIIKKTAPFYSETDITTLSYRKDSDRDIINNLSDSTVENLFINDNNAYIGTIEDISVLSNCQNVLNDEQIKKHIKDHSFRFNSEFNHDVSVSSSIYISMSVEAFRLFKMELDFLMRKTFFLRRIPRLHRLSTLHSNLVNIYGCDSLYVKKERAFVFNAICESSLCFNLRKNIKNLSEGSWREINTLNSRVFPIIQILISLVTVFAAIFVCSTEIWNGFNEYSVAWWYLNAFVAVCALFIAWNVFNRFAFNPNNFSLAIRNKIRNKKTT